MENNQLQGCNSNSALNPELVVDSFPILAWPCYDLFLIYARYMRKIPCFTPRLQSVSIFSESVFINEVLSHPNSPHSHKRGWLCVKNMAILLYLLPGRFWLSRMGL